MHKQPRRAAFTLVELAIVITIIGLLIGGVLKGQELLLNARSNSLVSQVKAYSAALTTFRDIYKGLPGDIRGRDFITGCTAGNNCNNGDQNGAIGGNNTCWYISPEAHTEPTQAWKYLALAGLIQGVSGTADPAAKAFGSTHPSTSLGGGFHINSYSANDPAGQPNCTIQGIGLFYNAAADNTFMDGTVITPQSAYRLDDKMDDGNAYRGDVQGFSSSWGAGGGCGPMLPGNGRAQNGIGYEANNGRESKCDMVFLIGK